jgi:hypothetical protein
MRCRTLFADLSWMSHPSDRRRCHMRHMHVVRAAGAPYDLPACIRSGDGRALADGPAWNALLPHYRQQITKSQVAECILRHAASGEPTRAAVQEIAAA